MSAFTPDAALALDGAWPELRSPAAERLATASMPSPDEEIWRYSRVDQLDLDRFVPALGDTEVHGAGGLLVDRLPELFPDETPDVFAELNRAFMTPTVLSIPPRTVVPEPIVVVQTPREVRPASW